MKTYNNFIDQRDNEPKDDQIDEGKLSSILKASAGAVLYNKAKTLQRLIKSASSIDEKIDNLTDMLMLSITIIATIAYKSFSKK